MSTNADGTGRSAAIASARRAALAPTREESAARSRGRRYGAMLFDVFGMVQLKSGAFPLYTVPLYISVQFFFLVNYLIYRYIYTFSTK